MRAGKLVVLLAATAMLTAGCASSGASQLAPATPRSKDTGVAVAHTSGSGGPSAKARMVCSDEVADAVRLTFSLPQRPARTHAWSDQVFSCSYQLPGGSLTVSVKDATNTKAGNAYFAAQYSTMADATPIRGAQNFGFPAFETSTGNVLFLKDGKTLQVDPSALPDSVFSARLGRRDAAYSVASAVIACWKE
jgi:hypothetical protein